MSEFFINHNTCAGNEIVEASDLREVKQLAQEGMRFTQRNVNIEDLQGNIITQSQWENTAATEEDQEAGTVLEQFGTEGFYIIWSDELENM